MLYLRNSLIFCAMTAVSFTAAAQEVYKSVNEDGVVEYSDTPQPGSQEIVVDPNVVEVEPVVSADPAPKAPPVEQKEMVESEADLQSDRVYDVEDRKKRAVVHEEIRDEVTEKPGHKGQVKRRAHSEGARRR